jgi:hypothetical protein
MRTYIPCYICMQSLLITLAYLINISMLAKLKIILLHICFLIATCPLYAQKTVIEGKFMSESKRPISVKVGEYINYTLVMKHPEDMEVRFPDSTFNYAPFEFIKKIYYPTITQNGISTDSTIYQLATYETDSVQYLVIPAYVMKGADTTLIRPNLDSVLINPIVLHIPDTVKILENTTYNNVRKALNYPYLLIGVGAVVVIAVVLYFIFGDRIRKAYTLRRLKRNYEKFMTQFERYIQSTLDSKTTENSLGLWKSYLENLQEIPYTTFTSKEIEEKLQNKDLTNSLRSLDRAIYGNLIDEATKQSLVFLQEFAQNAYQLKIEEVRNA